MEGLEISDPVDRGRRNLIGAVGTSVLLAGRGAAGTGIAAGGERKPVGPSQPRLPVRQITAGELDCGYVDLGAPGAPVALLLHGWPYDIHSFATVAPLLIAAGYRVVIPYLRGYGTTRLRLREAPPAAQQVVFAVDMIALLDALSISKAVVAGFDWGARTANIMAALWPERCRAMVSVSGYLIGSQEANARPLAPAAEYAWWYQFYFSTQRGYDGYAANRLEFNRLIWQLASPRWEFTDKEYARSASAFDNPDHVDVVINNYRWRLGLVRGEARYDALERTLASAPSIAVPTITLEGDANGAPHPPADAYAHKFEGAYMHRVVGGGVGHNLPQEAPRAFAEAILDAARLPGAA